MINHKTMTEILHKALTRATLETEKNPRAALDTLRAAVQSITDHSRRSTAKPHALLAVEREIFALAYRVTDAQLRAAGA